MPLAPLVSTSDDGLASGEIFVWVAGGGEASGVFGFIHVADTPIRDLQPGDADQDMDFDQLDLVHVQQAGKYLTGEAATWGEGDWNGAPGGSPNYPPTGDGVFNQLDIVAAQQAAKYLTGPYAANALAPVPEPSSCVLLAVGLLAFGAWAFRYADTGDREYR